jgi:hypothetical protein
MPASPPASDLIDLWIAMFGEPPPVCAAPPVMIAALVESLPIPPVGTPAPRDDGAF